MHYGVFKLDWVRSVLLRAKPPPPSLNASQWVRGYQAWNSKNLYNVLDVAKDASQSEIKEAYYKLSKKHHPDLAQGDAATFKAISEAYATLGNAEKRQEYDAMMGFNGHPGAGFGPDPWSGGGGGPGAEQTSRRSYRYSDFAEWREQSRGAGYTSNPRSRQEAEFREQIYEDIRRHLNEERARHARYQYQMKNSGRHRYATNWDLVNLGNILRMYLVVYVMYLILVNIGTRQSWDDAKAFEEWKNKGKDDY